MLQKILEVQPSLLMADGFDDCLKGLWIRDGKWVALYSASEIVEKLSKDMPEVDAIEYFEFNVQGAYMGPMTPVFVWDKDPWDFDEEPIGLPGDVLGEKSRMDESRRAPT